ncbi:MAG: hypothetical protein IOC98_12660 [Rhodobacter sp.]|nr:hypothetical protein [Rhodobacter sp.]MCA3492273.1 hypothetical protein [Rhodobacter sp.]MCA3500857.1 hypothetical protein [Rhodobacter sp.]
MAKETFDDCHACFLAVGNVLEGYSVDIVKVVLLSFLRGTLVDEATSPEMLAMRADQVAAFIKAGGD